MMLEEWCGRRYYSFSCHLRKVFGEKVYRVSLDAGFTCPNRDGTKGLGGCIFCDAGGSRAGYVEPELPVTEQLLRGMELMKRVSGARKFIAYFQAFSNTYAPVSYLEKLYKSVLQFEEVVGISISTRPDLLPDEVLDLLEDIGKSTYLWLEIGVQTMKNETLAYLNRGHTMEDSLDAIVRAKKREHIRVLAHVILGLPGETLDDMLNTASELSRLEIDGIKMHHLYVIRGTVLEKLYLSGKVKVFENVEDYAQVAVEFLENLSPNVIVHRLSGYAKENLVAPKWTSSKLLAQNVIERLLRERDTYQGRRFRG